MSHEIRTPMNAIIGMAELALRENPSDEISEMIGSIQSASASLLSIINDILDFSKIESGKMELSDSNYNVASLIHEVASVIGARIAGANLEFFIEVDPGIPAVVRGDEVRLRQILFNLLSNGVKYTKKGSVTLRLEAYLAEEFDGPAQPSDKGLSGPAPDCLPGSPALAAASKKGAPRLRDRLEAALASFDVSPGSGPKPLDIILKASVIDTGIGIKPDDLGKLFGSFSQVNTEQTKGIEGTGLGLAISKNLALLMGGDITVESEYEKGSVFTVTVRQTVSAAYAPLASLKDPGKSKAVIFNPGPRPEAFLGPAIESLGAQWAQASNLDNLRAIVKDGDFNFLFASLEAQAAVTELIKELKSPIKPVIILNFGEKSGQGRRARVIHKPIFCVPVANALNEAEEAKGYAKEKKDQVSFIAPEAKALVVDDIFINLKVAKGILSIFKISVDTADSGQEAIELVKANNYDIIFMDHMMPGMDGIETTGKIRDLPEGQGVPIIALTANAITGVKEMFISSGMNDFISKPIERGKLETLLSEWLPKEKIIMPADGQVA
jgi:signal transduction histidine kinase/CheY-like chemotaxis protein